MGVFRTVLNSRVFSLFSLFALLLLQDNGDGQITQPGDIRAHQRPERRALPRPRLHEFIDGASRLKGHAKAIDIWRMETKAAQRGPGPHTAPSSLAWAGGGALRGGLAHPPGRRQGGPSLCLSFCADRVFAELWRSEDADVDAVPPPQKPLLLLLGVGVGERLLPPQETMELAEPQSPEARKISSTAAAES